MQSVVALPCVSHFHEAAQVRRMPSMYRHRQNSAWATEQPVPISRDEAFRAFADAKIRTCSKDNTTSAFVQQFSNFPRFTTCVRN